MQLDDNNVLPQYSTVVVDAGATLNLNGESPPRSLWNLILNSGIGDAPLSVSGFTNLSATEGAAFSGTVATFTGPVALPAGSYDAITDWGDGQKSSGTVSYNAQSHVFSAQDAHTYAEEGAYTISVSIIDEGGSTITAASSIVVADAPLSSQGNDVVFTRGTQFSGRVATFEDAGGSTDASEFSATITWTTPEGTSTSAGVVTYNATAAAFIISGSCMFNDDTGNSISVPVSDAGGSTATAVSTPTTIAVTPVAVAPTEAAAFSGTVASFSDSQGGDASIYSATIYRGDDMSDTVTNAASAAGQIVANQD